MGYKGLLPAVNFVTNNSSHFQFNTYITDNLHNTEIANIKIYKFTKVNNLSCCLCEFS